MISENMLSQVENEGFTLTMFDSIRGFKQDEQAVSKDNQYATTKRGSRRLRKTTCGWKPLVRWKDRSESWIPLKDVSNPTLLRVPSLPSLVESPPSLLLSGGYLTLCKSEM